MKGAWLLAAALVLVVTGCGGSKGAVETGVSEPAPPPMAEPMEDVEDLGGEPMAAPVEQPMMRTPSASEITSRLQDIHFDFDKSVIRQVDRPVLMANARLLMDNPQVSVVIEGHCDERGTTAYNLALGERRAEATRQALESMGVSGRQLRTVSYGEERPLCSSMNDSCWAQNRRAHLSAN